MELSVESFDGEKYFIEVGVDDTIADIRQKVASAAELCEDGFDISFGGKVMVEGDDTTQLSAGDTVVLTKMMSQKDKAIAALRDLGETRLTAERFEGLADPTLVHLFLQAEVVTEIPPDFLRAATFEVLDLSGASVVTKLNERTLNNCSALHTVDFSGWSNVTHIGCLFLADCSGLRSIDLSGWNNVEHIGYSFLANCSALTTLNLSGWNKLVHIGSTFLYHCTALRTLDLSGWSSVGLIYGGFLVGCTLHNINVTGSNSYVVNVSTSKCHCITNDSKSLCVCM